MQQVPPIIDVMPKMPYAARSVLHVGCGNGALGRFFRPINPSARFYGIEADAAAAKQAQEVLNYVAVGDIDANPLPFTVEGGFDCIVYDGILENLYDPWVVVKRQAEALTRDGIVLMSLPNPFAWQVLERLLRGQPDAELRCPAAVFEPETVMRQLLRAGLVPCDVTECQVHRLAAAQFLGAMAPALGQLGVDQAAFAKRSSARRLLWRVRKEQRQRIFITGNMLEPVGGVSHVRVVHPLNALATDPSVITQIAEVAETSFPQDGTPRILVLHRPAMHGEQGKELIRKLSDAGYLLIAEFDDHPEFFPMMQNGGALSFEGAHAVQTTTPVLAEVLRKYNPEIMVFPNAMAQLPGVINFKDPNVISLFFGALNRESDWEPLMPVLNEVAELANGRLRFQVVHDRGFFEALQTEHKQFTPTCDYDTYLRILGSCEVCFMPLSDTPFNRAKSDLKFVESGACRTAALASPIVYADTIENGKTGFIFNSPDELRMQLLRILAVPEAARTVADAARDYITKNRMLAYQVAHRITWYRSLWERREALFAAQRERVWRYYNQAA
jgi:SAM-dependent methyltransferase